MKTSFIFKTLLTLMLFITSITSIYAQNCTMNAGVSNTSHCLSDPLFLDGNASGSAGTNSPGDDPVWSQIAGPTAGVVIVDVFDLGTQVTGITAGNTYTFRLTATCQDGVTVHNDVTYTVVENTVATATDIISCNGTDIGNLTGNIPSLTGEVGEWTIIGTDGAGITITDIANPTSLFSLNKNDGGNTTLRWTISGVGTCESYVEITITNRGGRTVDADKGDADNSETLTACYETSQDYQLDGSFPGKYGDQQGAWSLVSGPSTPVFQNINNRRSWVYGLIEGTYIYQWDVTGTCVNGTSQTTIIVPPSAGAVTTVNNRTLNYCGTPTEIVLEGVTPQAGETVEWTFTDSNPNGASPSITSPTSATTTVTGIDAVTYSRYDFQYTITNSGGCSDDGRYRVEIKDDPAVDITDADMILQCGDDEATINFTNPKHNSPYDTEWRIISGPYTTNWTNTNASPVDIDFTEFGTFTVSLRNRFIANPNYGCDDAFDNINITISETPTASNAGTNQVLACNIVETDLAGNTPVSGSGQWAQISGPNTATVANVYDASSNISGLIEGVYTFRWIVSGGPYCPATEDEVDVTVSTPTTTTTGAGADQAICGGSIVYLEAGTPAPNETGTWSIISSVPVDGTITFSDIHDPDATVTELNQSTIYNFRWSVESECASASADVKVVTSGLTGPSIADAGGDQCQSDGTVTINMAGNNPAVGTGTWTILNGPNTPTITDINLSSTTIAGMINGIYEIEWAITNVGCQVTRDTTFVTIAATSTTAIAGSDQGLCGNSVTLAATPPTDGEGTWTQVSGLPGWSIDDEHSPTAIISSLSSGSYIFQWEVGYGTCPSTTDEILVNITNSPPTADAGTDIDICNNATSTTLAATLPAGSSAFWSIQSAPNTPDITDWTDPTTNVSSLESGVYTLRWNVNNGPFCPATEDDMIINVARPADAGSDDDLCNSEGVLLEGNPETIGTWSNVSDPGTTPVLTVANPNSALANGLTAEGNYTFRYTLPAIFGCPSSSDDVLITQTPIGVANAVNGGNVCLGNDGTVTVSNAVNTVLYTAYIGGSLVATGTGTGGDLDITIPSADLTPVGTYTIELIGENGTCTSELDNDATIEVVDCAADADLEIVKTVDNSTPSIGSNIVFTLTVTNNGTQDATNVVVNDLLPSGYAWVSDDGAAYDEITGVWTIGSLTNGSVVTLNITCTVLSTGIYANTATVAGDQNDPIPGNNTSTNTPDIGNSDLQIVKTVNNSTPTVGDDITFTLTVTNNGPDNATNVVATDIIPTGYTYLSDNGGGTYVPATGLWTIGNLANGANTSLQITVTVNASGDYTNSCSVTGDEDDSTPGNNDDDETPDVKIADLQIAKTVDDANPNVGDNIVFTLTVTNNGGSDATGVAVTDVLPTGYSFVNATASTGSWTAPTWTIGNLNNGDSETLDIEVTVLATGIYMNSASVSGIEYDPTPDNDDDDITPVIQRADLEIQKTVNNSTPNAGDDIIFTLTVTNNGPDAATGVSVIDNLPTGYTYVSETHSAGTWSDPTWTIGNLPNGASESMNITCTVLGAGDYTNSAAVTGNEDDPDPSDNNDDNTPTVSNAMNAVLSVTQHGDEAGPTDIEYTVTLSELNNTGSDITFDFDDLTTGTATSGSDYTAVGGSATITVANGSAIGTIIIPVTDDVLLETTETVICQISNPSNTSVTITTPNATANITDNDGVNAVLSVTQHGDEAGPTDIEYTVTLSELNNTGSDITFDFDDLTTGTATSGSDYTAVGGSATITVANGSAIGTIIIPVTDDVLLETTETVICQISNPSNGSVTITTSDATANILDDDELTAIDDYYIVNEDESLNENVSVNDIGLDNTPLTFTIITDVTNGTLVINNDGTFTYIPNENYYGNDSFVYEVCDANSVCSQAIATIIINPVNDVPVAVNDTLYGNINTDIVGNASTNDFGLYDTPIIFTLDSDVTNGTLYFNDDGTFTYTPNQYFFGTDSFTYSVCDDDGECSSATVILIIETDNNAEIIIHDAFSPNNDGFNDFWVITGIENYPNNKVLIFNRWGNKIYEKNGYLNEWDGTNMFGVSVGNELPNGTYFYILETNNGSEAIKGYIYLSR